MDALKIEMPVIGGFDWGARTACIIAAVWPQRFKALVAVSGYLISSQAAVRVHEIGKVVKRFFVLSDAEIRLHGYVPLMPNGCHLQLDRHSAQLLDRARCTDAAVSNKRNRLPVPLVIGAVDGFFSTAVGP